MTTNTTYKVGDKVRILDASNIKGAEQNGLFDGAVTTVANLDSFGDPRLTSLNGGSALALFTSELKYIEKAAEQVAKFKVGDKVRILDVSKIHFGGKYWKQGDVLAVNHVDRDGDIYLPRGGERGDLIVTRSEFPFIEKVTQKPTKNQRISTLEQEVEALKAEVAALKEVKQVTINSENFTVSSEADIESIASKLADVLAKGTKQSPNEQRKAIVAEAKAFVAKHITPNTSSSEWNSRGAIVYKPYGVIPNFFVNEEKRVVTLVLNGAGSLDGRVKGKYFAKCAPTDVFNADIGKAIALGRALGLDVKRFEQAVQPSEVVVGQIIRNTGCAGGTRACTEVDGNRVYRGERYITKNYAVIVADTEAQY